MISDLITIKNTMFVFRKVSLNVIMGDRLMEDTLLFDLSKL